MSVALDRRLENVGTKFRIFPQPRFLPGFEEPELITVSLPPDEIQPGPADNRMFVVDAINNQDYPIVQAAVALLAFIFVGVNLAVDLLYAWLDPRISYS